MGTEGNVDAPVETSEEGAAGEPESAAGLNPFMDASSRKYYYKAVMGVAQNRIT